MYEQYAHQDFNRALNKAGWRKILSWLTGSDNKLLPYDEFRQRLPTRGQHYIGLRQVPLDKIIGSMGRYNDFDRAFSPLHTRTKDRWINIDKAHYDQIHLPPVELYKMGDIYFVKDGNHRVSVARERGQIFIDAYITEIDLPVKLTQDIRMDDLAEKKSQADFYLATGLNQIRPEASIEVSNPDLYDLLLEHIQTHQWFMGVEKNREVALEEAVASWFDNVYLPVVREIREQELTKVFTRQTEADLYLWIMEYQKYLRLALSMEDDDAYIAKSIATNQMVSDIPDTDVKKLIQVVDRSRLVEKLILEQERARFFQQTCLNELRPEATIETTLPGKYERLLDHIATHRWYLGENQNREISYEEAVLSWFDNVYMPIIKVIRDLDVLEGFPERTETDLYLWIVRRQWLLREEFGEEIPIKQAAENVTEHYPAKKNQSSLSRIFLQLKKWVDN